MIPFLYIPFEESFKKKTVYPHSYPVMTMFDDHIPVDFDAENQQRKG